VALTGSDQFFDLLRRTPFADRNQGDLIGVAAGESRSLGDCGADGIEAGGGCV
jgi:hypothetical protein